MFFWVSGIILILSLETGFFFEQHVYISLLCIFCIPILFHVQTERPICPTYSHAQRHTYTLDFQQTSILIEELSGFQNQCLFILNIFKKFI